MEEDKLKCFNERLSCKLIDNENERKFINESDKTIRNHTDIELESKKKITTSYLGNDIETQKGDGSRETSSRNKHAKDDIIGNDDSRKVKCNSYKPKMAEENSEPPIIKGTKESIDISTHTDNDTIEHALKTANGSQSIRIHLFIGMIKIIITRSMNLH